MKNKVRIYQILMQKFSSNKIAKDYGWTVDVGRFQRIIALYNDHTWEQIAVIYDKLYSAKDSRQPHIANRLRNKTRIEASRIMDNIFTEYSIIGKNLIAEES